MFVGEILLMLFYYMTYHLQTPSSVSDPFPVSPRGEAVSFANDKVSTPPHGEVREGSSS